MMEKENVKLLKPHSHAGKEHKKGDTIEVTSRQAKWLIDIGVAEKTYEKKRGVAI